MRAPRSGRPRFTAALLPVLLALLLHQAQARSVAKVKAGRSLGENGEIQADLDVAQGALTLKESLKETEEQGDKETAGSRSDEVVDIKSEIPLGDPEIDPGLEAEPEEEVKAEVEVRSGRDEELDGESLADEPEDGMAKKRRRNEAVLPGKAELESHEEAEESGIRRFDANLEPDGEVGVSSDGALKEKVEEEPPGGRRKLDGPSEPEEDPEEAQKMNTEKEVLEKSEESETKEEIQNELRSLATETRAQTLAEEGNNGYRYLAESQGKSRFRSSTVYLNAEEKKGPALEQESIVNGQIRKLISIRDDVLVAVSEQPIKLEEAKVLNGPKEETSEGFQGGEKEIRKRERSAGAFNVRDIEQSYKPASSNLVQRWKQQATMLQEQMRNSTFLERFREEEAGEVLPEIPKFTEGQLLETLKQILSSKRSKPGASNLSYAMNLDDPTLTKRQLEIIRCAERLVNVKQRQSFVSNMLDCVRSLSVLNCMRIFVWPIVADNLPESITQNLANLPVEINLIDLFQRPRPTARSKDLTRVRLLTPESVVFSILKDTLDTNPNDNAVPTFIDPKNETLRRILTTGQLEILRMAERFLPEAVRKEYSDRMFSCVRRFEYFSCIKYFAWPMIKQYFPALPAFPDYQNWYPTIALFPDYPIVPFPGLADDESPELPEVVDTDATRMRKPRPEAVIVQILRDALKNQARVPSSPVVLEQPGTDSYITVIPEDQLLTVHMAEQLVPVPYRPEFVQKTIRCIQEVNYLTCIRYSTWPIIRQFYPSLPDWVDLGSYLPEGIQLPAWSDLVGYLPELPDIGSYFPGGAQPIPTDPPPQSPAEEPSILKKSEPEPDLETRVEQILLKVRQAALKSAEGPALVLGENILILTRITEKQAEILRLAESLVPISIRGVMVTRTMTCVQRTNDFLNCTRDVVWPCLSVYVPDLPQFPGPPEKNPGFSAPSIELKDESKDQAQERIVPDVNISSRSPFQGGQESRNKVQPVISVTGTRFAPIFTEHPESVILNILRSVQLATTATNKAATPLSSTKTQQFVQILSEQQETIIRITETLLPEQIRPMFVDRMLECVRQNNFLVCSRDVLWPTMFEYFPSFPSFPNFGILQGSSSTSSTTMQTLTESEMDGTGGPLSETVNVKTDKGVTITDTRFFPILNELPESVILNILKAVQLSTPNLPKTTPLTSLNNPSLADILTEQQMNVVQVAEGLLPVQVRPVFVDKMLSCLRDNRFLDCTRDIAWPTVAQFFPRLPNFPNFGSFLGVPRTKLDAFLDQSQSSGQKDTVERDRIMRRIEERLESVLTKVLSREARPRLEHSYLNTNDPSVSSLLSDPQVNIIRLVERGIPDPARRTYITRMLECVRDSNFVSCTQKISWPVLRQFFPSVGSFPNLDDLLSQLPQAPDLGSLPQVPDLGQFPQVPGFGQIPQVPSFGQFPQVPGLDQLPQAPGLGQLPNFPSLSSNLQYPQYPEVLQTSPGLGQLPGGGFTQFSGYPQYATLSRTAQGQTPPHRPAILLVPGPEKIQTSGVYQSPPITPSVGLGFVPEYAGQPTNDFLLNLSNEKVQLPNPEEKKLPEEDSKPQTNSRTSRRRRSTDTEDLLKSYYEAADSAESPRAFPNVTESEFLQLLINLTRAKGTADEKTKTYYVDTLNSTIRESLTADQREILKVLEDLNEQTSSKSFLSRVVQCIRSLSFIRCMGIFVWPIVSSNLPSLPSFPSVGLLGRSTVTENVVHEFFGMSTSEFEKEMLTRKQSIEDLLLDWYRRLNQEKFQAKVGFLKVKGYGNGELGISFAGFRKGRGTKIKDNKNLPSILTIISDIMEEVLDQRPDTERIKKDKDKRDRRIRDSREMDFQFLKDTDEFADLKRSIEAEDDKEVITMFLERIKPNSSSDPGETNGEKKPPYLSLDDAYNAFEVLFGTKINGNLANRLKSLHQDCLKLFRSEPVRELDIVSLETRKEPDSLKVLPLQSEVTYDLEKESPASKDQQRRQKRGKPYFKSVLDKYSDGYLRDTRVEGYEEEEQEEDNTIKDEDQSRSELILRLPSLEKELVPRKSTGGLGSKMMQMLPGVSLVISFLVQMVLSHARAAATVAGMMSNMAMGSAIFGMIRDAIFGQNNEPHVMYVYDNDKTGPGVTWPQGPYGPQYHG